MDKKEIACLVKLARKQAGLTQEQLGIKVGMFKESISRIESGVNETDITTLRKIANALNCDLDVIFKPKG